MWGLHNIYGYGYRRWCSATQCSDGRLHSIARVAAEGIKEIILDEERQREQEVEKHVDDEVPLIVEKVTIASAVQNANCVVAPSPSSRVLKLHHSDVSTGAPSCAPEWQESTDDEATSCPDTGVCEPDRGRRHPRRPRIGRRARARALRERWEADRRVACLESRTELPGEFVGTLLACIVEDGSDEERRLQRCEADAVLMSDDSDNDVLPLRRSSEDVNKAGEISVPIEPVPLDGCNEDDDDDDLGQAAPKRLRASDGPGVLGWQCPLGRGTDGQALLREPGAVDPVGSDKGSSLSSDEGEHTDVCSDMNEVDETELARLADHDLWLELDKGARLLPAKLVLAMIRLQEASSRWQARMDTDDLRLLVNAGVRELEPTFRRVRAVVSHLAETWVCPPHLGCTWAKLQEWLLDGEDGPCWQKGRFEDLLDDLSESRRSPEIEAEWLNDEVHIRSRSLQDGWDHFLKLVDDLDYDQARKLHGDGGS